MGFVKAEEEELGDGGSGLVGRNQVFFRLRVGIFADQGLYVVVGDIFEFGWVFAERREVFEEQEGCRGVFEGR